MLSKMHFYRSILWYFGLQTLISSAIGNKTIPQSIPATPPEIRLVDYVESNSNSVVKAEPEFQTHHEFDNGFLKKNGSDYVVLPGLYSMTFLCKSEHPVIWTVPHPVQVIFLSQYSLTTNEFRSSIPGIGNENPRNQEYYSWVTFVSTGDYSISYNLTCESTDPLTSTQRQSSIYVFRGAKNAIEKQGEIVTVPVNYNASLKNERFVLPCRPALPNLNVTLEKEVGNSTSYTKVEPSSNISFDPKIGFSIRKGLFESDLYGNYRCSVNKNDYPTARKDDEEVIVDVTKYTKNLTDKPKYFKTIKKISGNASVSISGNYLVCCSGMPGVGPDTTSHACNSAGQCNLVKRKFVGMVNEIYRFGWTYHWMEGDFKDRDDCGVIDLAYSKGSSSNFVYCKGGNLELADFYQSAFLPNIQNIEERNKTATSLTYSDTADAISKLPVERRVFLSVGTLLEGYGSDLSRVNLNPNRRAMELRTDANQMPVINKDTDIHEFDRNHYYAGENLTFTCLALKFFYTDGIKLKLKWKNGTVKNLVQPSHEHIIRLFLNGNFTEHYIGLDAYHYFNEPIEADLEMDSVECYVPRWNSTEWDVLKYKLDIRPPILPTIETDNKNVNFHLTDTNAQISFNVHGGEPAPKAVSIFKDDKFISRRSKIIGNGMRLVKEDELQRQVESRKKAISDFSSIGYVTFEQKSVSGSGNDSLLVKVIFPNITLGTQGVYRCVAEGIKENVTVDIHVAIAGTSFVGKSFFGLGLFVGILLAAIGICFKFKLCRK